MTDRIRPVSSPSSFSIDERRDRDRRGRDRRKSDPQPETPPSGGALVTTDHPVEDTPAKPAAPAPLPAVPAATFAAQVIGQSGQKRGLKGGPPVLDAARSTYLGNEYSGKHDRRPGLGQDIETEI